MPTPLPDPIDTLAADLGRLAAGTHHDPHGVLGRHPQGEGRVRVLLHIPMAARVELEGGRVATRVRRPTCSPGAATPPACPALPGDLVG